MARLESDAKMGYYPTPSQTLREINCMIEITQGHPRDPADGWHLIDPCCGTGSALRNITTLNYYCTTSYGIELDTERIVEASEVISHVQHGSVFDMRINPLECMGLLYLNPPYDWDDSERLEMKFLKHCEKWLCKDGVLVFLVPELIMENGKYREWIDQRFRDVRTFRVVKDEYPRFKQVVVFGYKRQTVSGKSCTLKPPPYEHIEDTEDYTTYSVPKTQGPRVFQCGSSVTVDDINFNRPLVLKQIKKLLKAGEKVTMINPIFPLRKAHMVSMITAGMLDGKIEKREGGHIVVKGFSERTQSVREEDSKEITTDTYNVGIRVIDTEKNGGCWYDIR